MVHVNVGLGVIYADKSGLYIKTGSVSRQKFDTNISLLDFSIFSYISLKVTDKNMMIIILMWVFSLIMSYRHKFSSLTTRLKCLN
jgi:hypothetical protein